jgi:hypothetical protein
VSSKKQKEMSENLQSPVSKEKKPRGGSRTGAGRKPLPTHQKKEQFNVSLPPGDAIALKILIPSATERNELIKKWVRAYVINHGESDRLLAQSPLAAELLTYLETQSTPEAESLAEKLQSLVVTRELDELRVEGAIELPSGAYII